MFLFKIKGKYTYHILALLLLGLIYVGILFPVGLELTQFLTLVCIFLESYLAMSLVHL